MGTDTEAQGSSIHERQRAAIVATIPHWYSPTVHFAIPGILGLAAMLGSLLAVRDLRAVELIVVPVTMIFAFAFEWRVHQLVLHRRMPLLSMLYERHELHHHVIYTYDDMSMRSTSELRLILMPAYAVVLVFLIDTPFALLTARFVSMNAGCLFMATSMLFFLAYEWLHAAYHVPPQSFVGRIGVIARLREHHRRHHDPRLMKHWNFNVTVPLFDWVHRTVWTPEREAARASRRSSRRAPAHG
ncbi:Sterol desaturase [Minicystis rosea]|nr:Sterol desaturase [Minicystis rosea]